LACLGRFDASLPSLAPSGLTTIKITERPAPQDGRTSGKTMTPRRILIIQGHPDRDGDHFCHALADRYDAGARAAAHEVRRVDVARLDFPLLRSKKEWDAGALPSSLASVQRDITWADHLVLIFPLWLGDMPALLKGFLEQVARPGFAVRDPLQRGGTKLLRGRSARIVVTMGMPALLYRWYYRAHAIRSLERNILRFAGVAPVRRSLIGFVEDMNAGRRDRWLAALRGLGAKGA
jgi:putative NADPH-quinone reductase